MRAELATQLQAVSEQVTTTEQAVGKAITPGRRTLPQPEALGLQTNLFTTALQLSQLTDLEEYRPVDEETEALLTPDDITERNEVWKNVERQTRGFMQRILTNALFARAQGLDLNEIGVEIYNLSFNQEEQGSGEDCVAIAFTNPEDPNGDRVILTRYSSRAFFDGIQLGIGYNNPDRLQEEFGYRFEDLPLDVMGSVERYAAAIGESEQFVQHLYNQWVAAYERYEQAIAASEPLEEAEVIVEEDLPIEEIPQEDIVAVSTPQLVEEVPATPIEPSAPEPIIAATEPEVIEIPAEIDPREPKRAGRPQYILPEDISPEDLPQSNKPPTAQQQEARDLLIAVLGRDANLRTGIIYYRPRGTGKPSTTILNLSEITESETLPTTGFSYKRGQVVQQKGDSSQTDNLVLRGELLRLDRNGIIGANTENYKRFLAAMAQACGYTEPQMSAFITYFYEHRFAQPEPIAPEKTVIIPPHVLQITTFPISDPRLTDQVRALKVRMGRRIDEQETTEGQEWIEIGKSERELVERAIEYGIPIGIVREFLIQRVVPASRSTFISEASAQESRGRALAQRAMDKVQSTPKGDITNMTISAPWFAARQVQLINRSLQSINTSQPPLVLNRIERDLSPRDSAKLLWSQRYETTTLTQNAQLYITRLQAEITRITANDTQDIAIVGQLTRAIEVLQHDPTIFARFDELAERVIDSTTFDLGEQKISLSRDDAEFMLSFAIFPTELVLQSLFETFLQREGVADMPETQGLSVQQIATRFTEEEIIPLLTHQPVEREEIQIPNDLANAFLIINVKPDAEALAALPPAIAQRAQQGIEENTHIGDTYDRLIHRKLARPVEQQIRSKANNAFTSLNRYFAAVVLYQNDNPVIPDEPPMVDDMLNPLPRQITRERILPAIRAKLQA